MPKHNRSRLVDRELSQFASARYEGDVAGAWRALERAHILGQTAILLHFVVHMRMLSFALQTRDFRETGGQLFRLALIPIGHALRRLPSGNTGRSDVSAFAIMPVPKDVAVELAQD